jgi:mono/diheme cytochrome c family protein
MRLALLALPLLALAGCAGLGGGGEEAPAAAAAPGMERSDVVESGADLYTSYCASCHGVSAQGDGPAAETLRKPPSDLTRLGARWGSPLDKERLANFVDGREAPRAHGPPGMPVWGERLYPGERAESPAREAARRGTILLILEYLETLQRPAEAPAP